MTMSQPSRDIARLVQDACAGRSQPLDDLLLRRSGLPGPRPNFRLMEQVAVCLANAGDEGHGMLSRMRAMDVSQAPSTTSFVAFPTVGVLGLGVLASRCGKVEERGAVLARLREHADDARRELRDAVVRGLEMCWKKAPEVTVECLRTWSEDYFSAVQMLRAIASETLLQQTRRASLIGPVLARVDEAFVLAAQASRAHQRYQGYRALLRSISDAVVALGKRHPSEIAQWISQHAPRATPELLESLEASLRKLQQQGLPVSRYEDLKQVLSDQQPPARDPRWNVGPTRRRGKN